MPERTVGSQTISRWAAPIQCGSTSTLRAETIGHRPDPIGLEERDQATSRCRRSLFGPEALGVGLVPGDDGVARNEVPIEIRAETHVLFFGRAGFHFGDELLHI